MLGVQRPTISIAAGELERARLIVRGRRANTRQRIASTFRCFGNLSNRQEQKTSVGVRHARNTLSVLATRRGPSAVDITLVARCGIDRQLGIGRHPLKLVHGVFPARLSASARGCRFRPESTLLPPTSRSLPSGTNSLEFPVPAESAFVVALSFSFGAWVFAASMAGHRGCVRSRRACSQPGE